jgi:glycosyltransferase domain-containing protein
MSEIIAKDITFVLTLKDRFEDTENWIKYNLYPEYNYLIADGSIGNENRDIFKNLYNENIDYVYCGPDLNIEQYLKKIYNSIRMVNTKYVMLCDNDDYINRIGINECIYILNRNSEYTCSGGTIFSVFKNKTINNFFNIPIPFLNNSKLHNLDDKFKAFIESRTEYKYLWYSVYRKESLEKIWLDIISLKIYDLFLVEMLYSDLALYSGKYFDIGRNHYVRLMNTNSSGANMSGAFYHKKIFFDSNYRNELLKINKFYANLYAKSVSEIESAQSLFYLGYFNNQPRVKNGVYRKFHGLLVKFQLFDIKICIKVLNIFYSLKKIF